MCVRFVRAFAVRLHNTRLIRNTISEWFVFVLLLVGKLFSTSLCHYRRHSRLCSSVVLSSRCRNWGAFAVEWFVGFLPRPFGWEVLKCLITTSRLMSRFVKRRHSLLLFSLAVNNAIFKLFFVAVSTVTLRYVTLVFRCYIRPRWLRYQIVMFWYAFNVYGLFILVRRHERRFSFHFISFRPAAFATEANILSLF